LDLFVVGQQYDVGSTLGALMLCEGWAEPIDEDTPKPARPSRQVKPALDDAENTPPNLIREMFQPHYEGRAIAMDRRPHRRRSK